MAAKAMKLGYDILLEKPISSSKKELMDLLKIQKQIDIIENVDFNTLDGNQQEIYNKYGVGKNAFFKLRYVSFISEMKYLTLPLSKRLSCLK